MKRWFIRLSVLSGIMVCGWFAIAGVQQTNTDPVIESVSADDAVPSPTKFESRGDQEKSGAVPTPIKYLNQPVGDQAKAFEAAADAQNQSRVDDGSAASEDTIPPATKPKASVLIKKSHRDPFGLAPPATAPQKVRQTPVPKNRYQQPATPVGDRYPNPQSDSTAAEPATLPETAKSAQPLQEGGFTGARYRRPAVDQTQTRTQIPDKNTQHGQGRYPLNDQFADTAPPVRSQSPRQEATSQITDSGGGVGRPGGRHQEGPQAPQVIVEKIVPDEIQVGKPTTFDIKVVNTGNVTAFDVQVQDTVPYGTRLLSTKPDAQSATGDTVVWSLGNFEPGEEKYLEVRLMPEAEGEIGSIASVTFATRASARTLATKPELKIDANSVAQVMVGDQIKVSITVSNLGSGIARDVVLFENLPAELRHPAGADLEFAVGDLAPKESRKIDLTMTAARAGVVKNVLSARGEGSLTAEARFEFEVIAPQLAVTISGPRRRYLDRQATYTVQVANPGTAPAEDIELVSRLPRAMKFISANNAGHYDTATHAVYWSLQELPEGEQGHVKLVTLPTESGDHTLRVESTARGELSDSSEETVRVEGLAALFFEVVDVEDPVEVGGDTAYEIRVLNQGTKVARNIVVTALLPPDLKPLSAEGPTHGAVRGNQVVFEALPRLAPKADTTFTVRAQGIHPGDQRVQIQIQSDDLKRPVTKEESTRVYTDR